MEDVETIDTFQASWIVNTRDGKNVHITACAKRNGPQNQLQVFLKGLREIKYLVTQDKALTPFVLDHVHNV